MQWIRGATTFSKLGGPISWSRVLLPFYRKKLDRSTQFGAVGYIITLYSSKSYVKKLGGPSKFGEVRTPDPLVVAPMQCTQNICLYMMGSSTMWVTMSEILFEKNSLKSTRNKHGYFSGGGPTYDVNFNKKTRNSSRDENTRTWCDLYRFYLFTYSTYAYP